MHKIRKVECLLLKLGDSLELLSGFSRFFVPGHKGKLFSHDATELDCTDDLYSSCGTIRNLESAVSEFYGSGFSCFSTTGNTLCIQSILRMAFLYGDLVVVPRNVHKSVVYAMALLNIRPLWVDVCPNRNAQVDEIIKKIASNPGAKGVFLTSPDYFGRMVDISSIRKSCELPILVDNAHGSHLIFFGMHPLDFGADFSADSAHKTLPVLTGGAWFHVGKKCAKKYGFEFEDLKQSEEVFASTSPSFLILESLENCTYWMKCNGKKEFNALRDRVLKLKKKFPEFFDENVDDPTRICINTNKIGYSRDEFIKHMLEFKIKHEFSTDSRAVLIPSPFNSQEDWERLESCFNNISPKKKIETVYEKSEKHEVKMSLHEAINSKTERIAVSKCMGRICAQVIFKCPPGVAHIVPGEVINPQDIKLVKDLGIKTLNVVKGSTTTLGYGTI